MSECVTGPPCPAHKLHFIRESTQTTRWFRRQLRGQLDQLRMRSTSVNDCHSGGRWMNEADKLLTYPTLLESCVSTGKRGRSGQGAQDQSKPKPMQMGLKIGQVTVKIAIAPQTKVNALCVSHSKQRWSRECRVPQIDTMTSTDICLSQSKPNMWDPLDYFSYFT